MQAYVHSTCMSRQLEHRAQQAIASYNDEMDWRWLELFDNYFKFTTAMPKPNRRPHCCWQLHIGSFVDNQDLWIDFVTWLSYTVHRIAESGVCICTAAHSALCSRPIIVIHTQIVMLDCQANSSWLARIELMHQQSYTQQSYTWAALSEMRSEFLLVKQAYRCIVILPLRFLPSMVILPE